MVFMALLAFVKQVTSALEALRVKAIILLAFKVAEQFVFSHFHRLLILVGNVNLHNVEGELVLHILADVVTILTMAIAYAKVPKILDFSEVFDDKEVVLVGLCHAVSRFAWSSQISELSNMIVDLADRLLRRWLRHRLLGCSWLHQWPWLAIGVRMVVYAV